MARAMETAGRIAPIGRADARVCVAHVLERGASPREQYYPLDAQDNI